MSNPRTVGNLLYDSTVDCRLSLRPRARPTTVKGRHLLPRHPKPISDDLIFRAVQKLIKGLSATTVAEFLSKETGETFSREQIYPLLGRASELGFLTLREPADQGIAREIATAAGLP